MHSAFLKQLPAVYPSVGTDVPEVAAGFGGLVCFPFQGFDIGIRTVCEPFHFPGLVRSIDTDLVFALVGGFVVQGFPHHPADAGKCLRHGIIEYGYIRIGPEQFT